MEGGVEARHLWHAGIVAAEGFQQRDRRRFVYGRERDQPAQLGEHVPGDELRLAQVRTAVDDAVADGRDRRRIANLVEQLEQRRHAGGVIGQRQPALVRHAAGQLGGGQLRIDAADAREGSGHDADEIAAGAKERELEARRSAVDGQYVAGHGAGCTLLTSQHPAPACKCGGPRVIPRLARDALLLGPARHVLHERLPEAPRWWAVIMYPGLAISQFPEARYWPGACSSA